MKHLAIFTIVSMRGHSTFERHVNVFINFCRSKINRVLSVASFCIMRIMDKKAFLMLMKHYFLLKNIAAVAISALISDIRDQRPAKQPFVSG